MSVGHKASRKRALRILRLFVVIAAFVMVFPGPIPFLQTVFILPSRAADLGSNNTTAPPPLPPGTAPSENTTLLPPGGVTQAATSSGSSVTTVSPPTYATVIASGGGLTAQTSYGSLVAQNGSAFVQMSDVQGNTLGSSTFAAITKSGQISIPGPATVNRTASGFRVSYDLLVGTTKLGSMALSYVFLNTTDKVSANFTPSGDQSAVSLAWLTLTELDYVSTGSTSGSPFVSFADISATGWTDPGAASQLDTSLGALKAVTEYYGSVMVAHTSEGISGFTTGFSDAATSYNGTFVAGNASYAGMTGNLVVVEFSPGHFSIDPYQTMITAVPSSNQLNCESSTGPTGCTIQKKVVFDGSTYWAFVYSGGSIQYYYSNGGGWTWSGTVPGEHSPGTGQTHLVHGFSVANNGKTVNVVWGDKCYYSLDLGLWSCSGSSSIGVLMSSGIISDEAGQNAFIMWATSTAEQLEDALDSYYCFTLPCSDSLNANHGSEIDYGVNAAYTTEDQLAFSYVVKVGGTMYPVLGWVDCSGRFCTSGAGAYVHHFSLEQIDGFDTTDPVPSGSILLLPFSTVGGEILAGYLGTYGANSEVRYYTLWITNTGLFSSTSFNYAGCYNTLFGGPGVPNGDIQLAGAATGAQAEIVYPAPNTGGLAAFTAQLGATPADASGAYLKCTAAEDRAVESAFSGSVYGYTNPTYLSMGTEWDGVALDLFFTFIPSGQGNSQLGHVLIVPQQTVFADVSGASNGLLPWAGSNLPNVQDINTPARTGHYVVGEFSKPNGNSFDADVFEYPDSTDFLAGPNDPWAQYPGTDAVGEYGGAINPSAGLLAYRLGLLSTRVRGGSESLSMVYIEPALFYNGASAPTPIAHTEPCADLGFCYYGYAGLPQFSLNLPWVDVNRSVLHLDAGQHSYDMVWSGNASSATKWFNNTNGIRFELKYVSGGSPAYYLYLSYGLAATFWTGGNISRQYFDSTGNNGLSFAYGAHLSSIQLLDSSVPKVTIGYSSGSAISSITYEGGKSISLSTAGNTLTVTDTLGRTTTFVVGDATNSLLTSVATSMGGKMAYSYSSPAFFWGSAQNSGGTPGNSLFSYPVTQEVAYNDTFASKITRQSQLYYHFAGVTNTEMDIRTSDGSGIWEQTTEYRFRPEDGTTSVRTIDATGQSADYDMETLDGGSLADLSGNGNAGTVVSTTSNGGRWGKALSFGSSSYVSVPETSSLKPAYGVAVSAWIYPTTVSPGASYDIVDNSFPGGNNNQGGYVLYITTSGRIAFSVYGATTAQTAVSGSSVVANSWYHVVGSYDGHGIRVYFDGAPSGSPVAFSAPVAYVANPPYLDMGCSYYWSVPCSAGRHFLGSIDEVRMYRRALSSDEVLSLYNDNAVLTGTAETWWGGGTPITSSRYDGYQSPMNARPTAVSTSYLDDWGNLVYSRDALGNETFASYANTASQGEFVQPARLDRVSSGRLYQEDFSYGLGNLTVSNTGAYAAVDYSRFGDYPPSLNLTVPAGQSMTLAKQISAVSTPDGQFRFALSSVSGVTLQVGTATSGAWDDFVMFAGGSVYADTALCGVSYTANGYPWYAVGWQKSGSTLRAFLNGSVLNCSPAAWGGSVGEFRIYVSNTGGSAANVWLDDIALDNGATGITVDGLRTGQIATLVSFDGQVLDSIEETSGSIQLYDRSRDLCAVSYPCTYGVAPAGGNYRINIYGVDGLLEYATPFSDLFMGDRYNFVARSVLGSRLVETQSGFGNYGTKLFAAPSDMQGKTGWTCYFEDCLAWNSTNRWSSDFFYPTSSSGSSSYIWLSPTSSMGTNYISGLSEPSINPNSYLVNYVYIPKGSQFTVSPTTLPMGIAVGAKTSIYSYWHAASWGLSMIPASYSAEAPDGQDMTARWVALGGLPVRPDQDIPTFLGVKLATFVEGKWASLGALPGSMLTGSVIKLVVKEGTLFGSDTNGSMSGFYYQLDGGLAYFGMTSVVSQTGTQVAFNGVPSGYSVALFWANNDTAIPGSTTTQCGGCTGTIYSNVYPTISAFPVAVKAKVVDSGGNQVYYGAPVTIWGGDVFTYMGQNEFYDQAQSNGAVHDVPIGRLEYHADCLDAVLCYDMESVRATSDDMNIGSGLISRQVVDLSRHGRDGTVSGSVPYASVSQSASGLGLKFGGSQAVISGLSVSSAYGAISAWAEPSTSTAYQVVVGAKTANCGGSYMVIDQDSSQWRFAVNTDGTEEDILSGKAPSTTSVTDLVLTWNPSGSNTAYAMYVNGAQVGTLTTNDAPTDSAMSGLTWAVGASGSSCNFFNGAIDQVAIYGSGLTATRVLALYQSRLPNALGAFAHLTSGGLIDKAHTAYGGTYVERTYAYDTNGMLLTSALNGNTTTYGYSGLSDGGFPVTVTRPDGKIAFSSYDPFTGNGLGSLSIDCHRTRSVYDPNDRLVQSAYYDTDPNMLLYLDMETSDSSGSLYDVSGSRCGSATTGVSLGIAPAYGPNGLSGIAGRFDGLMSYAATNADIPIASPMTLAAWVNPNGLVGEQDIIDRDSMGSSYYAGVGEGGYKLYYTSGAVYVAFTTASAQPVLTNYPSVNIGTTTNCGGTDNGDWSHPNYAYSSTDSGASATASPGNGNLLCNNFSGFGFGIPGSATIGAVKLVAHWKVSSTSVTGDLQAGLIANGLKCAVQSDSTLSTNFKDTTFDFTSCKTWTPGDLDLNKVSVDVGAKQTHSGSQTFSLDYVDIQVTYTTYSWQTATGVTIPTGSWTHVVATFQTSGSNTVVTVYTNGVQAWTQTLSGVMFVGANDPFGVSVGAGSDSVNGCCYYYFGAGGGSAYLDEVAIFSRALAQADIQSLKSGTYKQMTSTTEAHDDHPFPSTTAYSADSIPRVLYYDMSTSKVGSSNVLEDLSGNGNGGTLPQTGVTLGVPGKIGTAALFDGASTSYMSAPNAFLFPTMTFTMSFWIYPASLPSSNTFIAGQPTGTGDCIYLYQNNGVLYAKLVNTGGTYYTAPSGTLTLTTWTHVVFTFDGTNLRLYVNGAEQGSGTPFSGTPRTPSSLFEVGGYDGFPGIVGRIDEFHVLSTALTASQVANLYNGYTPNSPSFDPTHLSRTYYDGLGHAVREVEMDLYGHTLTTTRTIGWDNLPAFTTDAAGQVTSYLYDIGGVARMVVAPPVNGVSSVVETNVYPLSRRVESVDPLGRSGYTQTDLLGRPVVRAVASGSTYNYTLTTYNAIGSPTSVWTYRGNSLDFMFTYYYGSFGGTVMTVDPDGRTSTVDYDKDLRVFRTVGPTGIVSIDSYVTSGNGKGMAWLASVAQKASAGAATCYGSVYTYDSSDNLAAVANGTFSSCGLNSGLSTTDVTVTRTFDAIHRDLTERVWGDGASLWTNNTYDSASRVLAVQYPGPPQSTQGTLGYAYDTLGRPYVVSFNGTQYAKAGYDPAGRLASVWYSQAGTNTSVSQAYTYDAMGRITKDGVGYSTRMMDLNYTYDAASEVANISDNMYPSGISSPKTDTSAFDGNGRLVSAVGPFSTKALSGTPSDDRTDFLNYSYDAYGFALNKQDSDLGSCAGRWCSAQTVTYAPDASHYEAVGASTGAVTENFGYDGLGEMLTRSGFWYAWNFAGELAKVCNTPGCTTNSGQNVFKYTYDGTGRRVKEADNFGSSSYSTYYAYSGPSLIYSANGTKASAFAYLGDVLLFRIDAGGGGKAHFYEEDLSNNVRLIWSYASPTVTVEGSFRYKPFGEPATPITSPSTDPRFKYAEQDTHSATKLDHMGARYYAPDLGRFTSRDPLGLGDYAYAADDPLSFYDPSGLETIQEFQQEQADTPSESPAALPQVVVDAATLDAGVAAYNAIDEVGLDGSSGVSLGFNEAGWEAPDAGNALLEVYYGNPYLRALYGAPSYAFFFGYFAAGGMGVPTNTLTAGVPTNGRIVVVGENYEGGTPRIQPFAEEHGYEYYKPDYIPPGPERLAANRAWINARMDEGYTIIDLGPAPGREFYPYATSPYYQMELVEIAGRNYPNYLPIWGVFD